MEHRAHALALIAQVRSGRELGVACAAQGRLREVFNSSDESQAFIYVVKLLDVHPVLGKVSGRRLMASLGIEQFARVIDLTSEQKNEILGICGETV